MQRIKFVILLLIAGGALRAQQKPNIVIILADDMGYGDIACYGNEEVKTPNLDQMAREGVRFTDFHSNGPVCSPTRAALLTGRYQQRTGITNVITAKSDRDKGLDLKETTLAEALKQQGYVTGIFGKWHLGYAEKYNPVHQGFDEFEGYVSGNIDYQSHVDQEGYADWWNAGKLKEQKGYSTDLIAENAQDFIIRNKKQPFLLYIANEAPHYPYQIRTSRADRRPGAVPEVDFPVKGSEKEYPPVYRKMVEILDESVGETMATLKKLGIYDNTIVIFCSDNGAVKPGSNGALRGFKGSLWEGGHREPAIIQWPGHIKPGWQSDETVMTMDIFPTLLTLIGAKVPDGIDGISMLNHLLYRKPMESRSLFWQFKNSYAVRKQEWKLIIPNTNALPELYNLMNDLSEKNNLAGKYPQKVAEMLRELDEWKTSVADHSMITLNN